MSGARTTPVTEYQPPNTGNRLRATEERRAKTCYKKAVEWNRNRLTGTDWNRTEPEPNGTGTEWNRNRNGTGTEPEPNGTGTEWNRNRMEPKRP